MMIERSPSVSVVVPVYNSEETIGRCLESVVQQSFADLEVVLVDDGSIDQSGALCDEWTHRDERVRVVHQPNRGRTEARAVGTRMARGCWICYVDSDDELPAESLALLYSHAADDTDIVFGNATSLSGENRELIPITDFRRLAVRGEGTIGVPWGSLFRRSVLTDYLFDLPREVMMGEDYLFWLRLCFTTDRQVHALYRNVYRKGADHTSNSFVWTSDYSYKLNELRKASIPVHLRDQYVAEMVDDRLANLFAVAVCQPRSEWSQHRFYQDILSDIHRYGLSFPLKRRLFLLLPARWLRRAYSHLSNLRGLLPRR